MITESPSQFGKVLVTLRDIIQSSEQFKDIDVYYDDNEMNPNVPLPAISFKIGKKEVVNDNIYCKEYSRPLEIRLHTKTLDKRDLLEELLKYEEDLIHVIDFAKERHEIESFEIEETESSRINALMFNARKEGNQTDMTFFSNLLRVFFTIRYTI